MKLSLWPLKGFINTKPRPEIPITAMTGPSLDWLVGRGRLRRRAGSNTPTGWNGILEGSWGAKARRFFSAVLGASTDTYPSPVLLYTNEDTKSATLAFHDGANWRTVGDDFSTTTYPPSGVPTHRVVPMVYDNEYGGMTLHRLNTAEYRQHMAAGSRNALQVSGQVIFPGYDSAPTKWDGDHTVFPLGLVPPLQMPLVNTGKSVSIGPWKGSNAYFFSVLFESDKGELSMFTLSRPPGAAWGGYEGFGYVIVDVNNLTTFYDSMMYSLIPDGPPGTRWKHLMRSTKVDVASTGAGAVVQPSIGDMAFFARIPQGQTTYVDTNGNDLALDPDPRIEEMWKNGGIQWPARGQYVGHFDGHGTIGKLRPNPWALIAAPWKDGTLNYPIDDVRLYGASSYFIAVQGKNLVLRSVIGGSPTDVLVDVSGKTLRQACDFINKDATVTQTSWATSKFTGGFLGYVIDLGAAVTGVVAVGDTIANAKFPLNTRVVQVPSIFGANTVRVDKAATASSASGGEEVITVHDSAGTTRTWGVQVVPGADADESCDSLLRTRHIASCTFTNGQAIINVAGGVDYITAGMLVVSGKFAAGTFVQSVDSTTNSVGVSSFATSSSPGGGEVVQFGYDTGDTTYAGGIGFIRTFGNAFPCVLPWNKTYLDKFAPDKQAASFSAASPGYAQDGINTWLVRNRRGGPASFGSFMGMADLGPVELHFYAKGRMRLYNARTGLTHSDEDYMKATMSWTRGARSPYAICNGNGWCIFLADEGFFVCDEGQGEHLLSLDIYNSEMPEGQRGELEYAIGECIKASEQDKDGYKVAAQVHGGVLSVRYFKDATSTHFDREIRYDFSLGVGRSGVSEVLTADFRTYPWSAPLTLNTSVSTHVSSATGHKHLAAVDTNTGATDGRVDEVDAGTTDNGDLVVPVAYTGLQFAEDQNEVQPTMAYVISTKAGTGLQVSLSRNPEIDPETAEWDELDIPSSVADAYGRSVRWLKPSARLRRSAIEAKIFDDGTGTCPDVSSVMIEVDEVRSTTGDRRRPGV